MKPRKLSVAVIVVICSFLLLSCKKPTEPPPPPYVRTIDLAVIDSGFTDSYLRVTFLDTVESKVFRLHRDGKSG